MTVIISQRRWHEETQRTARWIDRVDDPHANYPNFRPFLEAIPEGRGCERRESQVD
jgi:hypothetical protein